jgi:hypothetical protein
MAWRAYTYVRVEVGRRGFVSVQAQTVVDKAMDSMGFYFSPLAKELVLCVDKRSQVQRHWIDLDPGCRWSRDVRGRWRMT